MEQLEIPEELRGPYQTEPTDPAGVPGLRIWLTAGLLFQLDPEGPPLVRRARFQEGAIRWLGYFQRDVLTIRHTTEGLRLIRQRPDQELVFHRLDPATTEPFEAQVPLALHPHLSPVRLTALRQELEGRFDREQELRFRFDQLTRGALDRETLQRPEVARLVEQMATIDRDNVAFLDRTLREAGWIDGARFGPLAARGAVLIALHSGHVPLLRGILPAAAAEWRSGQLNGTWYAWLVDRFRLTIQAPLHYGVQAMVYDDGIPVYPLGRDRAQLDRRRHEIGQPPFEEALRQLSGRYRILELEDEE